MRGVGLLNTSLLTGLVCALMLGGCEAREGNSKTSGADNTPEETELSTTDDLITFDGAQYALQGCDLLTAVADLTVTSIKTGIDGNCQFARKSDESPQIYVTDSGAYALVVASVPHESGTLCDTTIRAVRLDSNAPRVSADEQNILMCSSGPFDEVLIVTLSDSVPSD